MKKSTILVLVIFGILVVGAACFGGSFLGMKYFNYENESNIKEEQKEDKKEETESVDKQDVSNKKEYKDFTKQEECWLGEMCTFKYTFEKQDNYESKVEVNDLFTYAYGLDFGMYFYILKDGDVYWSVKEMENIDVLPGVVKYDFVKEYAPTLNKLEIPSKIKRIKGINFGTGIFPGALFISEDGKVYTHDTSQLHMLEEFAEYEVDDIVEYDDETYSEYKAILKDGTIMTKTKLEG